MLQFRSGRPDQLTGNVYVEHSGVQRFQLSELDSRREACCWSDDLTSNAFQQISRRQRHQEFIFHDQDASSAECHVRPNLLAGARKGRTLRTRTLTNRSKDFD
jgi:hypothetical protein